MSASSALMFQIQKKVYAVGINLCLVWWAHTDLNRGPKDYEPYTRTSDYGFSSEDVNIYGVLNPIFPARTGKRWTFFGHPYPCP
ncbi:hypothetical protein EMIT0P2_100108 [Pseudomonas sp. IT-P2]